MGLVPARLAIRFYVLAGAYNRLSCFADAAIRQRRQLGPSGTPHMGSGCRQLVADGAVLGPNCHWDEVALQMGDCAARGWGTCSIHGTLWRGQDPLLSKPAVFPGPRSALLRRLGDSVLLPEALVGP